MEAGYAVLLLDSVKAEEIYTFAYPNKDLVLGKDVHSSALLFLGMKDLIFQITNNEIYLASFHGLRALYTSAGSHFVLVVIHSPQSRFQFLHPNFARDLVRCVEFQMGPDWASRLSACSSSNSNSNSNLNLNLGSKLSKLKQELDSVFATGIARFGAQGTEYAWVELLGGGTSEGMCVGEASEAQLCEAVANMEVGCTTKQHLVCVDVDGLGVIGTCLFSGVQQIYTTLSSHLARQVWEWLSVQHPNPNFLSHQLPPPPSHAPSPHHPPPVTRKPAHGEWQKIARVHPSAKHVTPNPRYPHTYSLVALAQEEFVVCVLVQIGGEEEWNGSDLRGSIVMDEVRGLLHSLRAAGTSYSFSENIWSLSLLLGTLTRVRKQLATQTFQMFPPSDLPYLLTPSPDIPLFHFVAHNQITGVVIHHTPPPSISPNLASISTAYNVTPLELVFLRTSEKIRKLMLSHGAHEHGVKVNLGDEQYWIVGRSSVQGTFFVCYSSSTPQSVVEMAYKSVFFSNLYN